MYIVEPLVGVGLGEGGERQRVHLLGHRPGVAPGRGRGIGAVGVVGVVGEGLGVGVRVHEVRAPVEQHRLVAAVAVLGDHLAAGAGQDLEVDAGLGEARLQRLRHVGEGRGVDHVEGDGDRGRDAGVGEDLLRLLRVVGERGLVERAGEALGPEGLVRLHLALEDGVGHALVVDEVARRLPHRLGLQRLDLLVEGEEMHRGLREDLDLDLCPPAGRRSGRGSGSSPCPRRPAAAGAAGSRIPPRGG